MLRFMSTYLLPCLIMKYFLKMSCLCMWIFLCILYQEIVHGVDGKQYLFVNKSLTWSDAAEYCNETFGGELLYLEEDTLTDTLQSALQNCVGNDTIEMWTSSFVTLSPFVSNEGCYQIPDNISFVVLKEPSVVDCYYWCFNSSLFAISEQRCACLSENFNGLGFKAEEKLCDHACDDMTLCGGKNVATLYSKVDARFLEQSSISEEDVDNLCVTRQCKNNAFIYNATDCRNTVVSNLECSSYYSCTFEPGHSCFFIQSTEDDADWNITKGKTPNNRGPSEAFEGDYYAFVDASEIKPRQRASLTSNVQFSNGVWCLRFRYYIRTSDRLTFQVFLNDVPIITFTKRTDNEWKLVEKEINMRIGYNITILVTEDLNTRDVAIDDVTMISGNCSDISYMLYMNGKLTCDFEGGADICFEQSIADDFDWTINKGRTDDFLYTGPDEAKEGKYYSYTEVTNIKSWKEATYISKFTIASGLILRYSMNYHMTGQDIGNLTVALQHSEQGSLNNIFNKFGEQGNEWKFFTNTAAVIRDSKILITGVNGDSEHYEIYQNDYGDIAIDNITVDVDIKNKKLDWLSTNRFCSRFLGSRLASHHTVMGNRCLNNSAQSWSNIFRSQNIHKNLKKYTENYEYSSKVKVLSHNTQTGFSSTWKVYVNSEKKSFICEKDSPELDKPTCSVQVDDTTVNAAVKTTDISSNTGTGTIVGISVGVIIVLVCIAVILIILWKRKKVPFIEKVKNGKGASSLHTTKSFQNAVYNNPEHSENLGFNFSSANNKKVLEQNSNSLYENTLSVTNNMNTERVEDSNGNDDNIYINQNMDAQQTDMYDHLHDTKTRVVSDMYSHTQKDTLYGLQESYGPEDEYDHANVVTVKEDNSYDYGVSPTSRDTDDVYSYGTKTLADDTEDTYDHTNTLTIEAADIANHSREPNENYFVLETKTN